MIDFEDGENHAGAQIGTHCESLGVTFANAIWIGAPFYGSHGEPSQFWFGKSGFVVEFAALVQVQRDGSFSHTKLT